MLEIIDYPDPRLTKVSRVLTEEEIAGAKIDDLVTLGELIDEMSYLMKSSKPQGVGLAAPQVGLNVRVFIALIPGSETSGLVFVNPELTDFRGSEEETEGCLSLPGMKVRVKRSQMVHVKARNKQGGTFESDVNGALARIVQHEFDHLDGKLIIHRGKWGMNKHNLDAMERMKQVYKRWEDHKKQVAEDAAKKKLAEDNKVAEKPPETPAN